MIPMPIKNWKTPCSIIPEQRRNNLVIKKKIIKACKSLEMNAMGYDMAVFLEDTIITILREGDGDDPKGIWMSDSPAEYFSMWQIVSRVKPPKILIGGLGLGLLVSLCLLRKDIDSITIIEKSQDIIDMVARYCIDNNEDQNKVEIICGNFLDYLKSYRNDYTTIIADIWKGGDPESWKIAILCRNQMRKNFPNAIHLFWNFQREFDFLLLEEEKKEEVKKKALEELLGTGEQ